MLSVMNSIELSWNISTASASYLGMRAPFKLRYRDEMERNAVRNMPKPIMVSARLAPVWEAELAADILKLFLVLSFVFGTVRAVHSQGIAASAQISGQPDGGDAYKY